MWRPIVRADERSGQANREEFLVAKSLLKNSFQKSGEALLPVSAIKNTPQSLGRIVTAAVDAAAVSRNVRRLIFLVMVTS